MSFIVTNINLAAQYEALGLFDKAKAVYEEYLNNFPDNNRIRQELAMHYSYQGKYDLALEEMDKAFALAPTYWLNFRRKGDIYLNMGDLKKAEEEYRKLLEKEEPSARAFGMQRLGRLFVLQGKFRDSIEMSKRGLKQAEDLGEKIWIWGATWDLAYAELKSGNPDEVEDAKKKLSNLKDI